MSLDGIVVGPCLLGVTLILLLGCRWNAKKANMFGCLFWKCLFFFAKNLKSLNVVFCILKTKLQNICKILYSERCPGDLEDETMKLFYDMTFELGEIFVTILTFTNYFYVGSPVMPLAVNIHERKFIESQICD